MKIRCGAMAERGGGPRSEQHAPEHCLATRRAGECGIDTMLEALPATGTQLVVDRGRCQAGSDCLGARDDAGLALQEVPKTVRGL